MGPPVPPDVGDVVGAPTFETADVPLLSVVPSPEGIAIGTAPAAIGVSLLLGTGVTVVVVVLAPAADDAGAGAAALAAPVDTSTLQDGGVGRPPGNRFKRGWKRWPTTPRVPGWDAT